MTTNVSDLNDALLAAGQFGMTEMSDRIIAVLGRMAEADMEEANITGITPHAASLLRIAIQVGRKIRHEIGAEEVWREQQSEAYRMGRL